MVTRTVCGDRATIGTLPEHYRPPPTQKNTKNKYMLIIPLLVCGCLVWFAYNQWQNPPQISSPPEQLKPKARIWWMPDLLRTLPPFADGYRHEKLLQRYNFTVCNINGNFPEVTSAMLCYLLNPMKYTESNQTISTDLAKNGLCGTAPPLTLETWDSWAKYMKEPRRRFAVIQHPLERFARQYHKICIGEKNCYDCNRDVSCFMRKIYKQHTKIAEGLADDTRSYLSDHFSPQTWNCHFHHTLNDVNILKIGGNSTMKESFFKEFSKVLGEQGVEESVRETIHQELMKIPMELTKEQQEIYDSIKNDIDKYRLFRYLYEHDYYVFGYNL